MFYVMRAKHWPDRARSPNNSSSQFKHPLSLHPPPDAEAVDMYTAEPHVFSAALKLYLRELPVPIMTYDLYPDFIAAGSEWSDKRKNLKGGT